MAFDYFKLDEQKAHIEPRLLLSPAANSLRICEPPNGAFAVNPVVRQAAVLCQVFRRAQEIKLAYAEIQRQLRALHHDDAAHGAAVSAAARGIAKAMHCLSVVAALALAIIYVLAKALACCGRERARWTTARLSECQRDWSWRSSASYCVAFDATPA